MFFPCLKTETDIRRRWNDLQSVNTTKADQKFSCKKNTPFHFPNPKPCKALYFNRNKQNGNESLPVSAPRLYPNGNLEAT